MRRLQAVESRTLGVILAASIAAVGILGAAQALQGPVEAEGAAAPGGLLGLFYLDGEYNVPAALSGALWLLAALGVYAAGATLDVGRRRWLWSAVALVFVFFALDEGLKLHERLEAEAGVDWQVLYAPLLVLTAVGGFLLVLRIGRGTPRALLLAAGAAAATAMALEKIQWNGNEPIDGYRALMVPEEILEMTAAALVAVATFTLVQAVRQPS